MMHNIEVDGHKALGFDTGLNARAFAQAKFAQFMTEKGLIVRPAQAPRNRVEFWKTSGVCEITNPDGRQTMVVWGPPVEGDRLDTLLAAPLNEHEQQDKILAAIFAWIQAILTLGENSGNDVPFWPCAAIIAPEDESRSAAVFFAPPSMAMLSVTNVDEWYVHPDLSGMDAAAFTAAAMQYRAFAGTPPFPATDKSLMHQDMREGNFLPVRLAVPGLDTRLAALLQSVLDRTAVDRPAGAMFLNELVGILRIDGQTVSAASLIEPLTEEDRLSLEKEKAQHLKRKTVSVKTRRFVMRNTALLIGGLAAVIAAAIITHSLIKIQAQMPSTAGMEPVQVIESYYQAFGELDHQMMGACVTRGAGKDDIDMVINFFVLDKTRQIYQFDTPPIIIPAHTWQGEDLIDAPLFGAADLRIEWLEGDKSDGKLRYRSDYTFWVPARAVGGTTEEKEAIERSSSLSSHHSDLLTLVLKKGNWRIAEIVRE